MNKISFFFHFRSRPASEGRVPESLTPPGDGRWQKKFYTRRGIARLEDGLREFLRARDISREFRFPLDEAEDHLGCLRMLEWSRDPRGQTARLNLALYQHGVCIQTIPLHHLSWITRFDVTRRLPDFLRFLCRNIPRPETPPVSIRLETPASPKPVSQE